ncbi:hypothetical protein AN3483.2 [Aspergillus nidulans FGSC A4]|uniref:Uncharacterized protein n=1 Tax=Emericella nidulans (strain FGSC A4 / ATCC 38163 / CBS 112.46 / NRRL 194 / M139) TaxID=227321 RepID=Q5B7J7_EMENI|nr:hypothetical protein AN3483.2 [Aspergillus nidulans FGSC A4]CBF76062.1 TPA: hypothetical protein ANIA_03483 [Aspergillus nidulans FGSC A4]
MDLSGICLKVAS